MRKPTLISLLAAAGVTAAVAVPAAPALAHGAQHGRPFVSASASAAPTPSATPRTPGTHGRHDQQGHRRHHAVNRAFVLNGTVTAVDAAAGTVSVRIKAGTERARRTTTVVLTVPATAVVRRNGVTTTLASLVVGDRVLVKGRKAAGVLTVQRVSAFTAKPHPTASPTVTPTATPTATPTVTATATATPTV